MALRVQPTVPQAKESSNDRHPQYRHRRFGDRRRRARIFLLSKSSERCRNQASERVHPEAVNECAARTVRIRPGTHYDIEQSEQRRERLLADACVCGDFNRVSARTGS